MYSYVSYHVTLIPYSKNSNSASSWVPARNNEDKEMTEKTDNEAEITNSQTALFIINWRSMYARIMTRRRNSAQKNVPPDLDMCETVEHKNKFDVYDLDSLIY